MERYEQTILTNMCMVYDDHGNVLVQDRIDPEWSGITFPGGHVEKGESFVDSVIREVWEETGLRISHPRLCGVKQWMNEDGSRYIVFCFKTKEYSGTLVSSREGTVRWVKLSDLSSMKLASGMEYMVRLFLADEVSEHYLWCTGREWRNTLK